MRAIEINPIAFSDGTIFVRFTAGDSDKMPAVDKHGITFASRNEMRAWIAANQANIPVETLLAQALARWLAADATLADPTAARGAFKLDVASPVVVTRDEGAR